VTLHASSVVVYTDATCTGIIQLTADTAERLCQVNIMDTHTMILKSPFLFLQVSMNSFVGDFVTVCCPGDRTTVSAVNPRTFYSNDDNLLFG
jgi:hypothetical protein